jgi:hypothetical protein
LIQEAASVRSGVTIAAPAIAPAMATFDHFLAVFRNWRLDSLSLLIATLLRSRLSGLAT